MRALRRFLGMVGVVLGGVAACGTQQEPAPPLEVFPGVSAEVPVAPLAPAPVLPLPIEKGCSLPPPGSTPTEALEAIVPSVRVQCGVFPGICMPEGHRRRFLTPPSTCRLHEPFGGLSQYAVEYDAQGRIRSFEGPMSWGESYRYDDCGRLVGRSYDPPGGMVPYDYSWEYGPDGRVLQYTVVHGHVSNVTRYSYGDSGRLLQAETTTVFSEQTRVVSARAQYVHDARGRIVRTQHEVNPNSGSRWQVSVIEERGYAPSGELAELRTTSLLNGSVTLKAFSGGRRSRELVHNHQGLRETAWTYWPDGLVQTEWSHSVSERSDSTWEARFVYGSSGRLDSVTTTGRVRAPDGTETSFEAVERYTYDAKGDLSARSYLNRFTGEAYNWAYEGNCY